MGGGGSLAGALPAANPLASRAQNPCWRVGLLSPACVQGSLLHPPTSREPTPVRGVALVLGGQNPITLEYQIYPAPIDTLVTGMSLPTGVQRIDRTGLDKTRYQLYSEARLMSSEVSKVLFKWTTVVFRSFSNNTKNGNFWRGTFYTFYIVRSLSGS